MQIRVFTDLFEGAAEEDGVPGDAASSPQIGFILNFQQQPC